ASVSRAGSRRSTAGRSSAPPTRAARESAELRERAPDAAHRLTDAVLVLDEREAHEALTTGAEPDARRHRHLGVADEQLGELEAAEVLVGRGYRCPDEHRALRLLDLPSRARETVDEGVASTPVRLVHLDGIIGCLVHRDDRRDLDGLERAVVEVTLQLRERSDDFGVAEQESHAPARHRERLGER